jgi:hypothetical protein
MKNILPFSALALSVFSLNCIQECTFTNNTNSKVTVTIAYKQFTDKACVTKTLYLEPKQKEIITETQKDCLPYLIEFMASDGLLKGKSVSYEAFLPRSDSFTFDINEATNNTLFFNIK